MIQRIQTVFLLIATILLFFTVFFPIAEFVQAEKEIVYELGFNGLYSNNAVTDVAFSSLPLSILIGLCLTLSFATIFFYKKRMLQIRLSIFNVLLLIGLQGLMFYYVRAAQIGLPAIVSYKIFFIFPVVAAILVFLALRAISRDEALVRSLDRLR